MIPLYRVQDAEGRGPFRMAFSHSWSSDGFELRPPAWQEEFGADILVRSRREGEHVGCAVRSLYDLNKWFWFEEQQRLDALGFGVVMIRANRIIAESQSQVLFARKTPLALAVSASPIVTEAPMTDDLISRAAVLEAVAREKMHALDLERAFRKRASRQGVKQATKTANLLAHLSAIIATLPATPETPSAPHG